MFGLRTRNLPIWRRFINIFADKLQAPEAAMRQYNRIADAIESLDTFPQRVKLMETEEERKLGLREMPVDKADFSGIREGIFISRVLHKAVIEVSFPYC
jgi:toxin ParE1/3/4